MTTLLIARHGNTFSADETPRRVGQGTDISLVESGVLQATQLGQYFKKNKLIPDIIYCSQLQRTQQTARGIIDILQLKTPMIIRDIFDEIDYGLDENKTEEELIARIGQQALDAWNQQCIVPDGWHVDPQHIRQQWKNFAEEIVAGRYAEGVVLVVTSNGIARFAPCLLDDEAAFDADYSRKIRTGSLCQMEYEQGHWSVHQWDTLC